MWNEFYLAVAAAVVLLYLPGLVFFKAFRMPTAVAACCAPIFSVCAYVVLPVIYYPLGVTCNLATVLAPTLALAALTHVAVHVLGHPDEPYAVPSTMEPVRVAGLSLSYDGLLVVAYAVVGALVCYFVFVSNLPRPDAFFSRYDNCTHLNAVQAFLDTGKWSTLHVDSYLATTPQTNPYGTVGGYFYPAAWHDVLALICRAADTTVTIATNALVAVICAVTYPVGMFLFLRAIFPEGRRAVALGALIASGSASMPWVFALKGPTWPNMLGMALLMPALGLVMLLVEEGAFAKRPIACGCMSLIMLVSLATSHPNAVFTAYVFLAAYGTHFLNKVMKQAEKPGRRLPSVARVLCLLAFWIALVAFWVLCYQVPLLDGILSYHWKEDSGISHAVRTMLSLGFGISRRQYVLSLLLAVGGLVCLWRRQWWLLFAPAYFALCYLASRMNWEFIKYWLAALWYMTPYRFASTIVAFGTPLMVVGFDWLIDVACNAVQRGKLQRVPQPAVVAVLVVAFCVANFNTFSLFDPETRTGYESAYACIRRKMDEIYTDQLEHVYSLEELTFVDKVRQTVPEDALVLNFPNDGSMWSYGVNQLNTYFRDRATTGQTDACVLIRTEMDQYAKSKKVRDAVASTGAEYLLMLDVGDTYENGVWLPQYYESQVDDWEGLAAVDDNTPGLEIVLQEGDMRLYRFADAA